MKMFVMVAIASASVLLTSCASMQPQPYSPLPTGVSIVKSPNGNYSVERIKLERPSPAISADALQFCFAQNLPGINGSPLFNSAKTRITAQGKDQVSFVVPRAMGTTLSYEIMFSLTASHSGGLQTYDYSNIRIRGTWTANEAPLPGSQEAAAYVDSALAKLNKVSDTIQSCLNSET